MVSEISLVTGGC